MPSIHTSMWVQMYIGVLCDCAQLHVRCLCVLSVYSCVCTQVCVWGSAKSYGACEWLESLFPFTAILPL